MKTKKTQKLKPKKEEKKSKFKLHYIGQNLYNIEIFETEAKRLGVNRTVAFSHLAGLKWGDPILLARYISSPADKVDKDIDQKFEPFLESRQGSAEIFGYFTITGLSHNLPIELSQELQKKLNIIKVDTNPHNISRACGSYNIGEVAYIANTLEDLLSKIKEIVGTDKEFGVNSYKWFVTGKYYPLQPFILDPATFSRGLQTVEIQNLNLSLQQNESASLVWIYNYKRRGYMNKLMKQRFEQKSKNKLMDNF